ncbi:DNA-binding IclR family transcriptional regulator [Arthrobacter pigmenti]|uniref:DNA-binding IclR family transcriptional regulator n=1 Tax=Arthrobacter pigmenti TaxID=271432 RepID=A0A846RRQ1_9MICC|nr:IclR family transcriptional regulator [Arthrobacter pigmenti]NJC23729.1 DNA-binding IclR family transcriptional regulator [Arthrobacter pigmenti]
MTESRKQSGAAKIMALLEVLGTADAAQYPHGMTVSEVARALSRDKSIISRQLKSLLESGLVSRDPSGCFELSWRLYALASRAGDQNLAKRAGPVMRRLTDNVRERSHLTVLSDGEVLTVRSESSRRSIETQGWVGRTIPVGRSSSGMALLMDHEDEQILEIALATDPAGSRKQAAAFLDEIKQSRQRQYTIANRIFDPEIIGIGTPIRDFSGRIVAALNISGPAARIEDHIPLFGSHLIAAATSLRHPDTGAASAH